MTAKMGEDGGRNDAEEAIQVQQLPRGSVSDLQTSAPIVIPRFSSFRPPKDSVKETSVKEDKPERRRGDDRHHKKRHRRYNDDDHDSGSPASHRDKRRRTLRLSTPPPSSPLIESDVFRLDTKGDPSNVIYGISYRYSVPHFHRLGAGYVLGLTNKWRIDRDKGEGQGLVVGIRGYESDKRRRGRNMFAVDSSRVGRLKPVEGFTKGFAADEEFVPVSRIDQSAEVEEQEYRALEVKKPIDDVESVSSEDEETFSYSEELRQRTIELDRKIVSNPHDIQAWLDYVALQDDVGVGQKASMAEIKMGILQKGLEKNPGNIKLLVELFKMESILLEYVRSVNLLTLGRKKFWITGKMSCRNMKPQNCSSNTSTTDKPPLYPSLSRKF